MRFLIALTCCLAAGPAMAEMTAQESCTLKAQMLEQIYSMPAEQRITVLEESMRYARRGSAIDQAAMQALNAVQNGITSAQAWKECGSY